MLIPEVFGRPGKVAELISSVTVANRKQLTKCTDSPLLWKLRDPTGNKLWYHPDDSTGFTGAYRYIKRASVKSMPPCLGALAPRQRSRQSSKSTCSQFGVSLSLVDGQVLHTTLHSHAETSALTWHMMLWVPLDGESGPYLSVLISMETS